MNKIDLIEGRQPSIDRDEEGVPIRVWISAQNGLGLDLLFIALKERLAKQIQVCQLSLPAHLAKLRSRFYQLNAVEREFINDDGSFQLDVRMPSIEWNRLCKQEPDLLYLINTQNNN